MKGVRRVRVNHRPIDIVWDADHAVHDENGIPVFGVCETDPDNPGAAHVSINGPLLAGKPHLLISTVAHELGHVVFDVPTDRRSYLSTLSAASQLSAERTAEWRANEFMGALPVPAAELHRALLCHARRERLRLVRAEHRGRPGCPVVDGANDADSLAGIFAVLAHDFGVSESFIEVRLHCYGLLTTGPGERR